MRIDCLLIASSLVAAGALLGAAQQPSSDTPQARFRTDTDLVQLDVSVLDSKRRPVRGLIAADFTITEEGQTRPIEAFSEVYLPGRIVVAAPWVREIPSDVSSNLVADDEGRIVIILLDRSIPVGQPSIVAKRIAAAAVQELGPGDLAAVVSTASGGASQNLTSDRARLLRTINQSDVSANMSADARELEEQLHDALGRDEGLELMTWTPLNDRRCNCGLWVHDTITSPPKALASPPRRRKARQFNGSDLILQSSAFLSAPGTDVGCDARLKDARNTMFAAVDRANLTIHSIDPSGLNPIGPISRTSSPLAATRVPSTFTRDTIESLQRQDGLKVLPDRTGGRVVLNTNAPDLQVPDIFTESASYYLLGFRPADLSPGEAFHPVSVRVNRRGVTVHTRSGYVTGTDDASAAVSSTALRPSVRKSLTGLMPNAPATLDVNALAFAAPGTARGTVALVVGLGEFASLMRGRASLPLDVIASAFDRAGHPRGAARQKLELAAPAAGQSGRRRIEVLSRIDLPPGDYEVRVAVGGADPAQSASVFTYVTIPAFDAEPLALSNVAIGAIPPTATAPKDFLSSLFALVPTAQREFAKTDRLLGFLRLYQGTGRTDPLKPVTLKTSLLDAAGTTVASSVTTLAAAKFVRERAADHFISLPLGTLTAGDYLLRIEATTGQHTAGRAVRFRMI